MGCPALPTCGLALAESERALPGMLTQVEGLLAELGLQEEELIVRMTGCPNGCARPYTAEIALVGKSPNKYQLWLGGNEASTRLNWLYKDIIKGDDLVQELRPLLMRFSLERKSGERFGDFCNRALQSEASDNQKPSLTILDRENLSPAHNNGHHDAKGDHAVRPDFGDSFATNGTKGTGNADQNGDGVSVKGGQLANQR